MPYTRAFATLLTATLFFGCAPKTETTLPAPPPEPNPQPQLASDVRARVQQLSTLADQYAQTATKLPGRNEQEDRSAVAQQFAQLAQILPSLNGPDMPGDFRQQLRIVDSTRQLLSGGSMDLSAEPTIDSGLRAAHRALSSVNQRLFTDTPDVAKSLDQMRDRVTELDTVSGPIHRLVVAQAFQASSGAITQMATALSDRLNDPSAPKPQTPAPTPAPSPVTPAAAEAPKPPTTPTTPTTPATPTPAATPETPKPADPKPAEPAAPTTPAPETPKPKPPELNKD